MSFRNLLAAGAVAALAASSLPAAAGADAARGAAIYERCAACHSLDHNRTGPRHCGLLGRRAGSLPDFDYSPAMRASGIVWSERTLDRFLAAPTKVVPGTSMGYAGIDDPRERADLIAWLREAARAGRHCGPDQQASPVRR
jgi:cytochrome c